MRSYHHIGPRAGTGSESEQRTWSFDESRVHSLYNQKWGCLSSRWLDPEHWLTSLDMSYSIRESENDFISHSAWSCWTENTTEAECKHWPLVVLTRAPLSSVTGGWTDERSEVRVQRSEPLWPHTTHFNLRTCREFRRDVCRGASAQDELHEVILVFPFRLLSLKQRVCRKFPHIL